MLQTAGCRDIIASVHDYELDRPTFYDGVISYSFTDGHQTLTRANSTATIYLGLPIENPSPGLYKYQLGAPWPDGFQPEYWTISISTPTSSITTSLYGDRYDYASLDAANFGVNGQSVGPPDGSHLGKWTVAVPEPSTLALLGAGLGLLGFGARRARPGDRLR